MLEKNSNLYINLDEELKRTKNENEMMTKNRLALLRKNLKVIKVVDQVDIKPTFVKKREDNDDSQKAEADQNEKKIMKEKYLKSTLIQFFVVDSDKRSTLIPIILDLVGCNEQQIQVAQRQWDRSNQLIQKTTGFFGF